MAQQVPEDPLPVPQFVVTGPTPPVFGPTQPDSGHCVGPQGEFPDAEGYDLEHDTLPHIGENPTSLASSSFV